MQFSAKILPNNRFSPQTQELALPSRESWIRHCIQMNILIYGQMSTNVSCFTTRVFARSFAITRVLPAPHSHMKTSELEKAPVDMTQSFNTLLDWNVCDWKFKKKTRLINLWPIFQIAACKQASGLMFGSYKGAINCCSLHLVLEMFSGMNSIGGSKLGCQGCAPPLSVHFLLFSCSFWGEIDQIKPFHAHLWSWRPPPPGNPGSATELAGTCS